MYMGHCCNVVMYCRAVSIKWPDQADDIVPWPAGHVPCILPISGDWIEPITMLPDAEQSALKPRGHEDCAQGLPKPVGT